MTRALGLAAVLLAVAAAPPTDERAAETCRAIAVGGSRAYVGGPPGLQVFDVSSAERPERLGDLRLRGDVFDVAAGSDLAFLAGGTDGLWIASVADAGDLRILSRFETYGRVESVAVLGSTLFVADPLAGLRIVDVADPEHPRAVGRLLARQELRAICLAGERLVTAEGESGVRVFDVREPRRPREMARPRGARGASDVAGDERGIAVACGRQGLAVYDGAYESGAGPVGRLEGGDAVRIVAVAGDLAVVSDGGTTLRAVSLVDRSAPVELSRLRVHRSARIAALVIAGQHAYAAADGVGLVIVDLSDPRNPRLPYARDRELRIRLRPEADARE